MLLATAAVTVIVASAAAQTRVVPPKNKLTPAQDIEVGLQAAAEVEKTLPLVQNDAVEAYFTRLGERLVAAAPADLNHAEYRHSFKVIDQKEINAFALPGGPMFLNRGMIEAADAEAGVAGVMAHELSHVLLRHGTANITKSQNPWLQLGQIAGVLGGAVVGGNAGAAIASGTQFGLQTVLLKYSREYEKQADLLGAQIMARAGYDPRELARMFERIAQESQGGSPQWMSSHPNPGNRTQYINQEAAQLEIARVATDDAGFEQVRGIFAKMPPALTAKQIAARAKAPGKVPADMGTLGEPVPPPSTQYRAVRGGVLQMQVPDNWRGISSNNLVKFVPRNAYGQINGQVVFTHGVEVGLAQASSRNLQAATRDMIEGLMQSNPDLRVAGDPQAVQLSGRTAIATPLLNRSEVTGGDERVGLYTTLLSNGSLFYYACVAPVDEYDEYRSTFARVARSIRLTDTR